MRGGVVGISLDFQHFNDSSVALYFIGCSNSFKCCVECAPHNLYSHFIKTGLLRAGIFFGHLWDYIFHSSVGSCAENDSVSGHF